MKIERGERERERERELLGVLEGIRKAKKKVNKLKIKWGVGIRVWRRKKKKRRKEDEEGMYGLIK